MPDEDVELDIRRDNRDLDPEPGEPGNGPGKNGVGAVVLHHAVTAVLLAIVLATGLWSYHQFRRSSFFTLTSEADRSVFEVYAVDAQRDRIGFALDVYQKLYDEYPSSLETLVDEGLLQESDLFYPVGERRFSYQRMGRAFQLDWVAPAGPAPEGEVVEDTNGAAKAGDDATADDSQGDTPKGDEPNEGDSPDTNSEKE